MLKLLAELAASDSVKKAAATIAAAKAICASGKGATAAAAGTAADRPLVEAVVEQLMRRWYDGALPPAGMVLKTYNKSGSSSSSFMWMEAVQRAGQEGGPEYKLTVQASFWKLLVDSYYSNVSSLIKQQQWRSLSPRYVPVSLSCSLEISDSSTSAQLLQTLPGPLHISSDVSDSSTSAQ
jgi:hypothetical protein